jgi:hypothetical protein
MACMLRDIMLLVLKIILTMRELGWCYIFWSIVCLNKWLTCETDKLGISSWCSNWTFTPNYKLRFEFNLDLKLRTTRRKTGNRKGIRKIEPCWANSSAPAHAHSLFTSPDGLKRAPSAQFARLALAHARRAMVVGRSVRLTSKVVALFTVSLTCGTESSALSSTSWLTPSGTQQPPKIRAGVDNRLRPHASGPSLAPI